MDWVSFDEIKRVVTLQMAIDRYGIPLRRVNAHSLRGRCPLPTHSSDKTTESFTATLNKGTGGAWACQSQSCSKARGRVGGNVLDFVAAMEQCTVRDAAIKLQTWFLVPAAGQLEPQNKEPKTGEQLSAGKEPERKLASEASNGAGESEPNKPLTFTLQHIEHAHAYLKERGITEETAKRFGVGFFSGKGSMHDRIVIPIHNATGELIAYAGRAIDASEPRYKFPAGFHKSLELFNVHRVKDELSVVLVEGFFDCMKVTEAGYPCIALMGTTMSQAQEKLIVESFASVVLMLDADDAGRTATEDIADRLQRSIFRVTTIELDAGAQPDQLSSDQIQRELDGVMV